MPSFSERFRYLRNQRRLSQQFLADQLGLSKSSVNMYERGEREPKIETLELIADYFNVDLDYLIGKSDIPLKHTLSADPDTVLVNDDPELTEYLEMLKSRPECRMLFSLAKNATKKDVEAAVAIIEALRKQGE